MYPVRFFLIAVVVLAATVRETSIAGGQEDSREPFLPAGAFTVSRGQLTFDAEGQESPASRFHSRRPHWPGRASGVTIGRGYDMKQRSQAEVKADLLAAGVDERLAADLAKGADLKGEAAKRFAADNPACEITPEQQKKLFGATYGKMEKDVRRIVAKPDVVEKYGATDWEKLNPAIRDLLVDLRFRGDYTPESRKLIQKLVAQNDLAGLIRVMSDPANWPGVPTDRLMRRLDYLRQAAGLPPVHVSIGYDDDVPKARGPAKRSVPKRQPKE